MRYFLLLGIFVVGCKSSNLNDRPEWAKEPKLPSEHPISASYPEDRFLTVVVFGSGKNLEEAKESAGKKARAEISMTIKSEVVAKHKSAYQYKNDKVSQNIVQMVTVSANEILSGLEEVLGWDGYEKDLKYYFGCYVLDKTKTGDAAAEAAKRAFNEIVEIQRRMPDAAQDESERLSIDALKSLLNFRLLSFTCLYFKRQVDELADADKLEQDCVKTIHEAGARREKSGSERDLEEALKFYEEALKYRPDAIIEGRVLDVKRKLPCLECSHGKNCITCGGAKGAWEVCPTCHGSLKYKTACPTCSGDGKAACYQCDGTGEIKVRCTDCSNGRVTCDTCRGSGQVWEKCYRCYGDGKEPCGKCNGSGIVYDYNSNKEVTCPTCRGAANFRCKDCSGSKGKYVKCTNWNCEGGKIKCWKCGGSGQVSATCNICGGGGRSGVCQYCNGAREVVVDCTYCQRGKVWVNCDRCRGTGKCPACGGRGHRWP